MFELLGFLCGDSLASRFYIETCGDSCLNYPQLNTMSLNEVYNSINDVYKYRKLYFPDVFKYINTDRSGKIFGCSGYLQL